MPWILSTLPPITTLFLQQLPPTCSRSMILKRSKLQPEDIPLPLLEAKSSLPADFQQRFDDNLSSESRHRKNLFIQSSPGNECKGKCYPTTDLWIHRYTKIVIREKQSHPFLYHHPSRLSSTWKRMDRVQGGQLRQAIEAWSGIIVVALEPIAVVYISYQKQRIFPRGVNSIHRSPLPGLSSLRRRIDPPKLTLTC